MLWEKQKQKILLLTILPQPQLPLWPPPLPPRATRLFAAARTAAALHYLLHISHYFLFFLCTLCLYVQNVWLLLYFFATARGDRSLGPVNTMSPPRHVRTTLTTLFSRQAPVCNWVLLYIKLGMHACMHLSVCAFVSAHAWLNWFHLWAAAIAKSARAR